MKKLREQAMKSFITARSGGVSPEEFAEHILRNYSLQERAALGETPVGQAFSVITRNLSAYYNREKRKELEFKEKNANSAKTAAEFMYVLDYDDLALMLAYFTGVLEDTVDAVFLASADTGFLTPERMDELLKIQDAARIMFESVMTAAKGGVVA